MDEDMQRRQALKYLGGGLLAVGTGRAAQNTVIGYGRLTGTNLTEQDLQPIVTEHLDADEYTTDVGEYELSLSGDEIGLSDGDGTLETLSVTESTPEAGAAVDDEYDLPGSPVEQLLRDVPALRAGEYVVEPSGYERFFDRLRDVEPRPFSVGTTRNRYTGADPAVVEEFLGSPPTDPERVLAELMAAFSEYSNYDVTRYLAGSVEDNVLMSQVELREYFESPTDFAAIADGENTGMFCTELTRRSAEALLAVPAHEATLPVVAGYVQNSRHKHAYTGIASLYRRDGELVLPMTFVDYTHTTQYDDFHVRRLLGEGLDAYDTGHRATGMYW